MYFTCIYICSSVIYIIIFQLHKKKFPLKFSPGSYIIYVMIVSFFRDTINVLVMDRILRSINLSSAVF